MQIISISNVTTHVVRLKLFRLKAEGTQKHNCHILAEKQQIFVSNMASKCAVFPLFLTAFSLSTLVVTI